MGVQVICFDWSGVISDDRLPVYQANLKLLSHFGKERISFEGWLSTISIDIVSWLETEGITGNPNALRALYKRYLDEAVAEGTRPTAYPGCKDVIVQLKKRGYKLAVLSRHPEQNLLNERNEYGLIEFFDYISGGVNDKVEGLLHVSKHFGVKPQDIVYICDTTFDVDEAKTVGTEVIAVCTGYHTKDYLLANHRDIPVIDSLNEVLEKL